MTTGTPFTLHCQFSQEAQAILINAVMGKETHGNPMAVPQDEAPGWFMENDCAFQRDREGTTPTHDVVPNIAFFFFEETIDNSDKIFP